jgi:hypothetical protein
MECYLDPDDDFYIGAGHQMKIQAPLKKVGEIVSDIDHYQQLFPGFEEVKIKERKGSEVFGSHPKHDSKHGKNFSVNTSKNCWHCFRHKSGGGPLEWLAVEEGIITCKAAGQAFSYSRDGDQSGLKLKI